MEYMIIDEENANEKKDYINYHLKSIDFSIVNNSGKNIPLHENNSLNLNPKNRIVMFSKEKDEDLINNNKKNIDMKNFEDPYPNNIHLLDRFEMVLQFVRQMSMQLTPFPTSYFNIRQLEQGVYKYFSSNYDEELIIFSMNIESELISKINIQINVFKSDNNLEMEDQFNYLEKEIACSFRVFDQNNKEIFPFGKNNEFQDNIDIKKIIRNLIVNYPIEFIYPMGKIELNEFDKIFSNVDTLYSYLKLRDENIDFVEYLKKINEILEKYTLKYFVHCIKTDYIIQLSLKEDYRKLIVCFLNGETKKLLPEEYNTTIDNLSIIYKKKLNILFKIAFVVMNTINPIDKIKNHIFIDIIDSEIYTISNETD